MEGHYIFPRFFLFLNAVVEDHRTWFNRTLPNVRKCPKLKFEIWSTNGWDIVAFLHTLALSSHRGFDHARIFLTDCHHSAVYTQVTKCQSPNYATCSEVGQIRKCMSRIRGFVLLKRGPQTVCFGWLWQLKREYLRNKARCRQTARRFFICEWTLHSSKIWRTLATNSR